MSDQYISQDSNTRTHTDQWSQDSLNRLDQAIDQILTETPQSISLYELIRALTQPPHQIFDERPLGDSMGLFETNFVVMNSLYRLRKNQAASYEISSLKIAKYEFSTSEEQPDKVAEVDPLENYYLDWTNFQQSEEDVNQLLNSFWERMLAIDFEESDLAVLALSKPVTLAEIKKQYRKLSQQYHPDKGGDTADFLAVQQAYERLTAQG